MKKKRLRHISLLLFCTFVINLCLPCLSVRGETISLPESLLEEQSLTEPDSFCDITGHWAEKEIKAWTARELAGGYPDGTFRPDSPITRAEFVTLVNRVFGYSNMADLAALDDLADGQTSSLGTYRDVAATDWFAGEFANAAAVGYLDGYPDGTVKPQNPLTRQEAAAIFARILPTNNNVLTDNNSNNSNNGNMDNTLAQFTDQAQIPEWSQAAIAAAVKVGYMNGYPDGSFQPAKPITRAEALSVLDRAVGTLYNRAGTYGPFQGTVVLEGNVTINTPGITLQNTTITGNLYLTEGIGEGYVTLDGVTVQGITKIAGGGSNSIHLLNTTIGAVLVNVPSRHLVRLLAQGSTDVGTLEARTPAILEEEGLSADGFTKVVIKAQEGSSQGTKAAITVELAGEFSDVEIEEATVQLDLQKGRIANLSLSSSAHAAQINLAVETTVQILLADTAATIQGQGTVEKAQANVDGVVIEAQAKNVQVADGIQANVAGKTITEDYTYTEPKKKKSKDASLSDLMINGTTVSGFAADTLSYDEVLPYGSTEVPTVTAEAHHAKARVTITQATGLTAPNNTAAVLVTAENGKTQTYTVRYTIAENSAKAITAFHFEAFGPEVVGVINEGANPKTITATVPYGTDVTALVPTIEISEGASISPASGIPQNFTDSVTNPVIYTVTAADGSTATYEVTVYIALNDEVSLRTFKIGGQDVKELAGVNTEEGATLAVSDFAGFQGIVVETTDPNASATVTLNETVVPEEALSTRSIAADDVIVVTVTAEDGETEGQYKVTVVPVLVTAITVTGAGGATTVEKDQSLQMSAAVTPDDATDKTVTWSVTEGTESATIDETGVLTGTEKGTVTVTATAHDGSGVTGTIEVTVVIPVTGVSLDKETTTLAVGENETLTVTVSPEDASNQTVDWESSDTNVATVDDDGKVTAVGVGTATITVTTVDGNKTDTCVVTVNPAPIEHFACSTNDGTSATFTWTAAVGATSIKIEQSGYNSAYETWTEWTEAYTAPIEPTATSAKVVGLTAGATYKFKLVVTGGNNAGDSNEADVTTSIAAGAATYGASWDSSTDTTNMTRLGDATGKTAGADFNGFAPWSGMERCTIDGQVMVKLPKFYYKHTYTDGVHEFWVADGPAEGFKLHPAFIRTGVEKEYVLMGAYKAGEIDDDGKTKLTSVSGAIPAVSRNINTFRTQARNRGTGWEIADALTRNAVALLYLVEYADTDSQATIGQGLTGLRYNEADTVTVASTGPGHTIIVSNATAGNFSIGRIIDVGTSLGGRQICRNRIIESISVYDENNKIIKVVEDGNSFTTVVGNIIYHVGQKTGGCDGLGNASGSADGSKGNKVSVSYRGLEDLWGNVWEFVDGINIKADHRPYVADHGFASDVFDEPYTDAGFNLPSVNGYVSNFACSGDADWLLMPLAAGEAGTGSGAYIPDHYYQATGNRVALVGGGWDRGTRAGLFGWDVHGTSSDAHLTVGARLLQIP